MWLLKLCLNTVWKRATNNGFLIHRSLIALRFYNATWIPVPFLENFFYKLIDIVTSLNSCVPPSNPIYQNFRLDIGFYKFLFIVVSVLQDWWQLKKGASLQTCQSIIKKQIGLRGTPTPMYHLIPRPRIRSASHDGRHLSRRITPSCVELSPCWWLTLRGQDSS